MKKLFAVLLAAGLSIPAYAEQVVTPNSSGDNPFIEYSGVLTARLTSTNGTSGTFVSSSPVLVYGVQISSVANTNYVSLYSTNSVQLGGASAKTIVFAPGTGTTISKFAAPMKFPLGLVIKANASVDLGNQSEIVILYRVAN
jgi:hypothetical protein